MLGIEINQPTVSNRPIVSTIATVARMCKDLMRLKKVKEETARAEY